MIENLQKSLVNKMSENQTLSGADKRQLVGDKIRATNQWFRDKLKSEEQVMTSRGLMNIKEAEALGLEIWEAG